MKDIIKANLATKIHRSYRDKKDDFREISQFLAEETENIYQWIKENTSEEARNIITAVENDDVELFKKLVDSSEEVSTAEDLYTSIVLEEAIGIEVFLLLFITRRNVKQFILSLLGDIKTTKVVPIAIMLIDLLQNYEEASELVKDL